MRLGANVVHKGNAKVHVSGHASAGELLYCYNILKPRNVMPVHGECRHLVANADARGRRPACRATGWSLAEDGVVVDLVDGVARGSSAPCPAATSTSTARRVGEIDRGRSRTAGSCGDEGFISVIVVVDSATGKVIAGPEIHARGFAEDDAVFDDVLPQLDDRRSTRRLATAVTDAHQLQQVMRRVGGRLGRPQDPPPPDDHPDGRRGLTNVRIPSRLLGAGADVPAQGRPSRHTCPNSPEYLAVTHRISGGSATSSRIQQGTRRKRDEKMCAERVKTR